MVKGLVFLLGPSRYRIVSDDERASLSWWGILRGAFLSWVHVLWSIIRFAFLPSSAAASSVYFGILFRLMFLHFYKKTILTYFPDFSFKIFTIFVYASCVGICGCILTNFRRRRRISAPPVTRFWTSTILFVHEKLESFGEGIRIFLARLILPQAHLIAAIVVLFGALVVLGTVTVWTVYAFSDELVYLYRNLAHLVRLVNGYLSHFSTYTTYANQAYNLASDWIYAAVMADSASTKTRDLYEFIAFVNSHQFELVETVASVNVLTSPITAASAAFVLARDACAHTVGNTTMALTPGGAYTGHFARSDSCLSEFCSLGLSRSVHLLGNATSAILFAVNQDLDSITENPYAVVEGFWELVEYYSDELKSGGTFAKGGDYLLTGLNYLKEILLQSGSISFAAIGSGVSIFTFLFDSVLQALIYVTMLFLLLQSNVGFYHYTAVLLHFIDPSTMLYRAIHRALRAILISSLKMAIFHAAFCWLLFSYSEFPLVCIPTIVAFVLGVVPVVSPVIVPAVALPIWAYAHDENIWAIVVLSTCLVVWWSVGTSIYAEIPDSSVWMTTFSVGLGISLFGARGVIIGPAIATIPFALYGLGSAYISGHSSGGGLPNFLYSRFNTPYTSPDGSRTRKNSEGMTIVQDLTRPDGSRTRKNSEGMTIVQHMSRRQRNLKKKVSIEPVSATASPVNMEKLITGGSNRDRLFDYIMSTPKGDKDKKRE